MTAEARERRDLIELKREPIPEVRPAARTAAATEPYCPDQPHVPCASCRVCPAALRGRLLPLLPVPLHQRPHCRRPHRRAGPWRSRPPLLTSVYFLVFGPSCSPAAFCSTATGRGSTVDWCE